ncbi:MAG: zinc ABC transporter substrate-binding protein [Spirochaetaceae bacterium]|nr:zinc ABC transporter substrate-binding protein [Spirochaetaceae bacterium]
MKKTLRIILMTLMMLVSASAFAASKKSIVCTTYPEYDWVLNVLGSRASAFNVALLQNKGTDLHSYQPSVQDIAKISVSDLFVYVGGESDEWVEDVLQNARNKNMIVINMMKVLGDAVREEEIVEGMQESEEHEHEHGHDHHEGEAHDHEHEEAEYDEHVWLSLRNAAVITQALSEAVQKLDSKNAATYKANAEAYIEKLGKLDAEFQAAVAKAETKTLVFADRFPFRYLADDYGLKYYAAFAGCSAESEASFETVIFLAKKIDELALKSVLTIEKSDKKIAKTVVSNTKAKNQQILEMDSLQSVTQKDIKGGKNYLDAMKQNLAVLKAALN